MPQFDHGFIVRWTTIGVACVTIGAGVWGFFDSNEVNKNSNDDDVVKSFQVIISCVNLIILSIVLLPAEFQFQWLKEGFNFIDNLFGKGLYIFFIGSWVICFHRWFAAAGISTYCLIVGIIDMCIGILYIIFYFGFGNPKSGDQGLSQPLGS